LRTIAAISLLLISSLCFSGVSYQKAQQIFKRLTQSSGVHVSLSLNRDSDLNAWADGRGVHVNSGLLKSTNVNELALVLGHELGHIKNGDLSRSGSKSMELRADVTGMGIANRAGFNGCAGITYFVKLQRLYGDDGGSEHPDNSTRINKLRGMCNGNK